jgi:hypothetical protein
MNSGIYSITVPLDNMSSSTTDDQSNVPKTATTPQDPSKFSKLQGQECFLDRYATKTH